MSDLLEQLAAERSRLLDAIEQPALADVNARATALRRRRYLQTVVPVVALMAPPAGLSFMPRLALSVKLVVPKLLIVPPSSVIASGAVITVPRRPSALKASVPPVTLVLPL